MAQSPGDQGRLLGSVPLGKAGGGRRGGVAAGILRAHAGKASFREARLEQRLDEEPCAVVLRFFLGPDHVLKLRHGPQALYQWLRGERVELLDAQDFDAKVAGLVARLHQLISELARAQHQAARVALRGRAEVGDDPSEVAVTGEVGDAGNGKLVPKQRLGRHQEQRLAEVAKHLPPEDVEVIGRRRAVGDLDIVLRA